MQPGSTRRRRWLGGVALAVFATAFTATTAPALAEKHEDKRLGFSITYPKKWKVLPVSPDSKWLVASFQSPRPYEWTEPNTARWEYHTPKLEVVIIPLGDGSRRGATVEETDTGVKVTNDESFADLEAYLDKTLRSEQGGFHFSDEQETTIDDRKVIQYEITFDKLVDVPRRVIAWAYYYDDAIYGVIADMLVPHEKKLRPELEDAFKSLKLFERTGLLPGDDLTGDDIFIDDGADTSNMTDADLEDRRRRMFLRELERIEAGNDKDWSVKLTDHFAVVSHTDARYTKSVADHCEALWDWMEKTLGYVGSGYAGKIIVRICADDDESSAYQNSRGWTSDSLEVVTNKDTNGWSDWAMESLNRGIFRIWLRDKNRSLASDAPRWISSGLPSFVEGARSKGRKIEFKNDTWDSVRMKELRRDDKLLRAESFFTMRSADLFAEYENLQQASFFVGFLIDGAGSKGKYKNVFSDYVKNLIVYIDEADEDAEIKALATKEAKTEEEENELFRKRQEFWASRESALLETLVGRTFPDWTDSDWAKLTALFWKNLE